MTSINSLKAYVKTFRDYQYLLSVLVQKTIQKKYKNSYLGILWSLLSPLLQMGVLTIIFSTLFRRELENFPLYLISGRLLFEFFSNATNRGLNTIINAAKILKKIYIPKYIIVMADVIANFIIFLISMIDLALVIIVTKANVSIYLLYAPFYLIFFFVFVLGFSFILATITVFFRDVIYLYSVFTMIVMYFSAIFYPASIIPDKYQTLLYFNPIFQFIKGFRQCIYYGQPIEPVNLIYCIGISIVTLVIGVVFFKRNQDKFIFYL